MGSPIGSSYIGVGSISMSIEPSDEKPQQANLSPARVEWTGQRSKFPQRNPSLPFTRRFHRQCRQRRATLAACTGGRFGQRGFQQVASMSWKCHKIAAGR
ncbi:hypothetical protein V6N11_031605 [Hibiscus sabdariffa]|uniref:Uncharacterized protein n=1 Tax=Hibiscus sabdariffa TaxID=183260 RepID=A0ABR2SYX4_9ROSI